MFISKKKTLACLLAIMSMSVTSAFAAENHNATLEQELNFNLEEYVVTAGRIEQRLFDANASVNVINSKEIELMQYDTLDKVLKNVPGVQMNNYMGGNTNANIATPIRINGSKNVLIMIDGVRINPVGTGAGSINPNLINNMDNVERVEVLKGAAGVLYGSDAAGGVINIITKKGSSNKTTVKASGGSFGKENYHFNNTGSVDGFTWNIYHDKDRKGSFDDGNGVEWENKFDATSQGITMTKEFGTKHKLTFKYDDNETDYQGVDPYDLVKVNDQYRYQNTRGINENKETVLIHDWYLDDVTSNKLSYRHGKYSSVYDEEQQYGNSTIWSNVDTRTYTSDTINEQFTTKFGDDHTFIAGVEYNKVDYTTPGGGYYDSDTTATGEKIGVDAEINSISFFIQDKWEITDKWNVTGGLRYDKADMEQRGETRDLDSNISKSLNIGHKFDDKHNLYVGYDEYFIIPTPLQMFSVKYGNMNLEPSNGKNYGIGYNHIFDDKTQLSAHAFYRKSEVDFGVDASTHQYINLPNSKDRGFDIQLNHQFSDKWSAFVGYAFLKHESEADAKQDTLKLGYLPRHSVNLGVNYDCGRWNAGLTAKGLLSRDDAESWLPADPNEGGWPDSHYWLIDLAVNYKASNNVKLFAVANNLLDVWYSESAFQYPAKVPGSIYAMPGRSFIIGAEISF